MTDPTGDRGDVREHALRRWLVLRRTVDLLVRIRAPAGQRIGARHGAAMVGTEADRAGGPLDDPERRRHRGARRPIADLIAVIRSPAEHARAVESASVILAGGDLQRASDSGNRRRRGQGRTWGAVADLPSAIRAPTKGLGCAGEARVPGARR